MPSSEAAQRLFRRSRITGHIKSRADPSLEPYATAPPEAGRRAIPLAEPARVSGVVLLNGADAVARQPFPHGAHVGAIFLETVDAAAGGAIHRLPSASSYRHRTTWLESPSRV